MSNNLLILNGEKLIVIPLKDIIGQTDENLNSIITAAFDPKETLTEIRDSINKELAKKPQKYFSKSTVVFNDELIVTPTGIPKTREQVREATGKQNIQQAGTGIGYQIIGQNNQIG